MPTTTTISEILKIEPGKIIPQVHGTIAVIAERYPPTGWMEEINSDGSKRLWSLQTIILEQDGAQIEVQIANKEPIPPEAKGKSLYLIAHQKARGGMSGVKVDVDEGRKLLRVSASGELVFAEPASKISAPVAQPVSAVTGAGADSGRVAQMVEQSGTEPGRNPGVAGQVAGSNPVASTAAASPATVNDANAWAEIGKHIEGFGDLYELCQARASRMNIASEAVVLSVTEQLFTASLAWLRGDLPGELPSGKL